MAAAAGCEMKSAHAWLHVEVGAVCICARIQTRTLPLSRIHVRILQAVVMPFSGGVELGARVSVLQLLENLQWDVGWAGRWLWACGCR